jgi:hypothetical protein
MKVLNLVLYYRMSVYGWHGQLPVRGPDPTHRSVLSSPRKVLQFFLTHYYFTIVTYFIVKYQGVLCFFNIDRSMSLVNHYTSFDFEPNIFSITGNKLLNI